jgi:myo-inositol-1(or 4)-monophosphatase
MPHDDLLTLARDIALQAGALAALRRSQGVEVAASKSSPVDVVTAADRETETLIRSLLADARPDDGFYGEESDASSGSSGLHWIVDPIDGTVNYLYGIPHYAVSVAVVEGNPDPLTWNAIAGCVVNPVSGEVFTATNGGGAFLNDAGIQIAERVSLSQSLIATGFAYDAAMRGRQGAVIAQLLPEVRDIRRLGTASLDLCFVAAGRVNAYFERTLSPWDHAAGALIAREAGAVVKGFGDAAPSSVVVIAAHPNAVVELEKMLITLGP